MTIIKNEYGYSKNQNPYNSIIYSDGELLTLKREFTVRLDKLICKADKADDDLIHLYLDDIKHLTREIDLLSNALEQNGASTQMYFET